MDQHRRKSPPPRRPRSGAKARQRKRRRRGQMRRFILVILVALCLIGVFYRLRNQDSGPQEHTAVQSHPKQEKTVSMEDYIADHESDYPASLRELLKRNPETVQFVYDYPKAGGKEPNIDLSGEVTQGTIPLFLQWDERWGYQQYGSDMIAITGCGPTCLSMVYSGLTGQSDKNPLVMAHFAEEQGYYNEGVGTAWALMSEGARQLGLNPEELPLSEQSIYSHLEAGEPIICTMGPGDFTDSGHYVVLTGVNSDNTIALNDPNSPKNSEKSWDLQQLMDQIENLWAYTAA